MSAPIAFTELCSRCRRKYLPAGFKPNPLAGDMHRAPTDPVLAPRPDPAADKVRRRHERKAAKRSLRARTRELGFLGAVKLALSGAQLPPAVPASEECEDCLRRARRTAARRLRFGPAPTVTRASA